jgi:hypothetical protein
MAISSPSPPLKNCRKLPCTVDFPTDPSKHGQTPPFGFSMEVTRNHSEAIRPMDVGSTFR